MHASAYIYIHMYVCVFICAYIDLQIYAHTYEHPLNACQARQPPQAGEEKSGPRAGARRWQPGSPGTRVVSPRGPRPQPRARPRAGDRARGAGSVVRGGLEPGGGEPGMPQEEETPLHEMDSAIPRFTIKNRIK